MNTHNSPHPHLRATDAAPHETAQGPLGSTLNLTRRRFLARSGNVTTAAVVGSLTLKLEVLAQTSGTEKIKSIYGTASFSADFNVPGPTAPTASSALAAAYVTMARVLDQGTLPPPNNGPAPLTWNPDPIVTYTFGNALKSIRNDSSISGTGAPFSFSQTTVAVYNSNNVLVGYQTTLHAYCGYVVLIDIEYEWE